MVIIETPTFTKSITDIIDDESYRKFQLLLVANPESGDIIPGGGGIRKIRIPVTGWGKRGVARVIYYWIKAKDRIYMLLAYSKNAKTTINDAETAVLKRLVKELDNG